MPLKLTDLIRVFPLTIFFVCSIGQTSAKPLPSDRFGVVGVIAQKSSPMSKQSLAVLRDSQGNRNLVVRVGDKLPGGFTVKSIKQNEVRIGNGQEEFLISPKSFDSVGSVASSSEGGRPAPELDNEDIEEEFVEPPPPGSPPGTPGERYRMSSGEIREAPPVINSGEEISNTKRPIPPPPPPRTMDGFGRDGAGSQVPQSDFSTPSSEFDDNFSGFDDLFEGP